MEADDARSRRRTWLAASAMTSSATDSSIEMAGAGDSRGREGLRASPAMARAPRRPSGKRNAAMALLSPPGSHSWRQTS